MPRATSSPASRKRRKKILKRARGFRGMRHRTYVNAVEAVHRAMSLATAHRKLKKRDFRSLWITRLSAACRQYGISYSRFIHLLTDKGVALNRKMLSEIAVRDPKGFECIVNEIKSV